MKVSTMYIKTLTLSVALLPFVALAESNEKQAVAQRLKLFKEDPKAAMEAAPLRFNANGASIDETETVDRERLFELRDRQRQGIMKKRPNDVWVSNSGHAPWSEVANNDRVERFVDAQYVEHNIQKHAETLPMSRELSNQPWSDDYWATYKGGLGARYADSDFPRSRDWERNKQYVEANPAADVFDSGVASEIDKLSPAEKFDLLIGDEEFSLTAASWRDGQYYYDEYGEVETWFGICHGWAPAAFMVERPLKPIRLLAADGETYIKFYPADIKALASLLWAKGSFPSKFIGGRCNDKDPEKDDNGRVISQDCFDNNPATWHLAVLHQIGLSDRSFVMDATFDYQVWNQPVFSYEYSYVNPNSAESVGSLSEALIDSDDYAQDPFSKYRSQKMRYIVGVVMKVEYMVEISPYQRENENSDYDSSHSVYYNYDLELDENYEIVGGEWHSNRHPDFLWVPYHNSQARSSYESVAAGEWLLDQPLPSEWQLAAKWAARSGVPLAKIVDGMVKASRL